MKSGRTTAGTRSEANRDAEQLLQDYLTALANHLIYTLEQKLGAAFRTIPLEIVLTVPAIWSEVAKEKTLRACHAAGFKTEEPISLVSEPVMN
jgi:molecular chaperone DnaK (HSP70)